jgi:AraC-like DNA-binding protein
MIELPVRYPLHRFPFVDTKKPDEVRQLLMNMFEARYFDVRQDNREFHVQWNFARIKQVDLGFSRYNSDVSVGVGAINMVRQMFALAGSSRTAFGSRQFTSDRNHSSLIPTGAEARVDRGAGHDELRLRIDADALQAKLAALIGAPITRSLEFAAPPSGPEMQRLRRILLFMAGQMDSDDTRIPDLVLAEYSQLVIVSFLNANRHSYSALLERTPRAPAPWQVRLVEEYIDANWKAPLNIDTLAAVTGGSARSIFKAFKEARGVSPMAFVKRVRLDHARRTLQRMGDATSVIDVAYHCGFLNAGHFARDYRRTFGELPSETLRNSKSRPKPITLDPRPPSAATLATLDGAANENLASPHLERARSPNPPLIRS